MKILLAPSETKNIGGEEIFNLEKLFLPEINSTRKEIFNEYKKVINKNNISELSKLFGLKKEEEIKKAIKEFLSQKTLLAIKRYKGVAFDYLDYESLDRASKEYLHNHLLIFSNLFGILKANDKIPYYKLKQGEPINGLKVDKLYHKALKEPLDNFLENEDILDLRAKYYEKFYKPAKYYTTLKFLKNGKIVSHWAKAYRGMVLREIAINKISSIDEFLKLDFKTLNVKEIIEKKAFREIVFDIFE